MQRPNPNQNDHLMGFDQDRPEESRPNENLSVDALLEQDITPTLRRGLQVIKNIRYNSTGEPMNVDFSLLRLTDADFAVVANQLLKLQDDGFQIQDLIIADNDITTIPPYTFRGLSIGGNFRLSLNQSLSSIRPSAFDRMKVGGDFHLVCNDGLTSLDSSSLGGLGVGGEIRIAENQSLTCLDVQFSNGCITRDLVIKNNPMLSEIKPMAFSGVVISRDLRFSRNQYLESVNQSAFSGINIGRDLVISHNHRLSTIQSNAMLNTAVGRNVVINRNRALSNFDAGAFSGLFVSGNFLSTNNHPSLRLTPSTLDGALIGQDAAPSRPSLPSLLDVLIPQFLNSSPPLSPLSPLLSSLLSPLPSPLPSPPVSPLSPAPPPDVAFILPYLSQEAQDNACRLMDELYSVTNVDPEDDQVETRDFTLAHLIDAIAQTPYYLMSCYRNRVAIPVLEHMLTGDADEINNKILMAMQSMGDCSTPVAQFVMQRYIGLMAEGGHTLPLDIAEKCAVRDLIGKKLHHLIPPFTDDVIEGAEALLNELFLDHPSGPMLITGRKNCSPSSSNSHFPVSLNDPLFRAFAQLVCQTDEADELIVVNGRCIRDDVKVEGITNVFLSENGLVNKDVENAVSAFVSSCAKNEKISNLFTDYLHLVEDAGSLCNADAFRSGLEAELLQRPDEDKEAVCNEFLSAKIAQLERAYDTIAGVSSGPTESQMDVGESHERREGNGESTSRGGRGGREGHWQNLYLDSRPSTSGLAAALPARSRAQEVPSCSAGSSSQDDNASARTRLLNWSSVRRARGLPRGSGSSRRESTDNSGGTQRRDGRSRSRSDSPRGDRSRY